MLPYHLPEQFVLRSSFIFSILTHKIVARLACGLIRRHAKVSLQGHESNMSGFLLLGGTRSLFVVHPGLHSRLLKKCIDFYRSVCLQPLVSKCPVQSLIREYVGVQNCCRASISSGVSWSYIRWYTCRDIKTFSESFANHAPISIIGTIPQLTAFRYRYCRKKSIDQKPLSSNRQAKSTTMNIFNGPSERLETTKLANRKCKWPISS